MGRASRICSVLVCAVILMLPHSVSAQTRESGAEQGSVEDANPAEDADQSGVEARTSEIEQITVTARRREERLQDTPVAVTSLSSKLLADEGIRDITDIGDFVPGLQIKQSLTGAASIFIRGIGQRDSIPDFDPGVALYVDSGYIARADGALLSTIDIERIEVLRGPQGTLYGKNAVGGAINFITRKPGPDYSINAEIRAGSRATNDYRLGFNIPIVDEKLYSRFAFASASSDGYSHNSYSDSYWDDNQMYSAVGSIRVLPSDRLTIDLLGRWSRERERAKGLDCTPAGDGGLYFLLGISNTLMAIGGVDLAGNPALNGWPMSDGTFGDFIDACDRSGVPGREQHQFESDTAGKYFLDSAGAMATVRYDVEPFGRIDTMEIKAIGSYTQQELDNDLDLDGSAYPLTLFSTTKPRLQQQWSGELQVNGSAVDETVRYTLGLYGFWETTKDGDLRTLTGKPDGSLYLACGVIGLLGSPGCMNGFEFAVPIGSDNTTRSELFNSSYAVYGQASWSIWQWLELTGGLRISYETKGLDRLSLDYQLPGMPTPSPAPVASNTAHVWRSFTKFTPMASIQYRPQEAVLEALGLNQGNIYFTFSQGFKSGGFSSRNDPRTGEPAEFEPEEVDSFEIGLKLGFWDNRVRLNTALFYTDYENIQLTVVGVDPDTMAAGPTIANAGQAIVKGVEIELTLVPLNGLVISSNLTLIDARYEEFFDEGAPPGLEDRSDEAFFNLPKVDVSARIGYDLVLEDIGLSGCGKFIVMKWLGIWDCGRLTPSLQVNYRSSIHYQFTPGGFASGIFRQGPVTTLSGRLNWEDSDGHYRVGFWINNITDAFYMDGAIDLTDFSGAGARHYAAPREMGVIIGLQF